MTEPGSVPAAAGANTDEESQLLLRFVRDQRGAVLKIVAGLAEGAWQKPVLPTGWTVAGMLWHLAGMEHHWRDVIMGVQDELPQLDLPESDEEEGEWDPLAPFEADLPSAVILRVYKAECARTDEILAATPLSAVPRGLEFHQDPEYAAEITSVRFIVLHIIEETATHSGHLEIARELLDGQTRLAGR
ncbi:MAG TPA: DinB family protein [Trebonia sp.]|jgi:uncharacterized damage-inducible protein DinB